ncbi:MAG TPA: hypothetical protein VN840_01625 [Streptosporangiaceae bacterium]|nr:hypothetical protein [Streptosporangiaceae bacterium]
MLAGQRVVARITFADDCATVASIDPALPRPDDSRAAAPIDPALPGAPD